MNVFNLKTFKEQTIRCIKNATIHLNDQIYEIKNDKYQAVNHRISIDSRLELLKSYWYWTEWDRTLEDSITLHRCLFFYICILFLFYSSFLLIFLWKCFVCWSKSNVTTKELYKVFENKRQESKWHSTISYSIWMLNCKTGCFISKFKQHYKQFSYKYV